jgi:hypothetical protein
MTFTAPSPPYRRCLSVPERAQRMHGLYAVIRAGDAELAATFKMLIYEIKEARLAKTGKGRITLPFLFARPL